MRRPPAGAPRRCGASVRRSGAGTPQSSEPSARAERAEERAQKAAEDAAADLLPSPSPTTTVPNFVIQRFRIPIFLLPIYQAAGIEYGVRWEVLAAINEIETDYGRNLNVSSAGAQGWMQFMPATWKMYGTDANRDGERDPYNPVDAIFAAAKYLKAAGAEDRPAARDLRLQPRRLVRRRRARARGGDRRDADVDGRCADRPGRRPLPGSRRGYLRRRARPRLCARACPRRREPGARRGGRRGARLHGHRGRAAREGDQHQRRRRPARHHEQARASHRPRHRGLLRQPLQLLRDPAHERRLRRARARRRGPRSSSASAARRRCPAARCWAGSAATSRCCASESVRPARTRRSSIRSRCSTAGACSSESAVYRPSGKSVLHPGEEDGELSIGQAILLPKTLLARRVLADPPHPDLPTAAAPTSRWAGSTAACSRCSPSSPRAG